jgi:hypothetical protein
MIEKKKKREEGTMNPRLFNLTDSIRPWQFFRSGKRPLPAVPIQEKNATTGRETAEFPVRRRAEG